MNARIFISKTKNIRRRIVLTICIATIFLVGIVISSFFIESSKLGVNLTLKNKPPSWGDLFGTDWLGRDMFARTLKGLSLSFGVGLLAAFVSTLIALIFSLLASIDRRVDAVVSWFIDLFLSVPHIVTLILISFAMGGGFKGVVLGLALTHWPSLTRVLRAEVMQIKATDYVAVSLKLGQSRLWIAIHHILPHILPQLFVGFVLLFPHAILHEAAITFLGFGLSSETPAIGIILSESMGYLSTGMWWLAFFPGISLLIMVGLFDVIGRNIRKWNNPFHSNGF
ncbi:peptide/nickel transport system permease protein [Lederbergia galactosidilyticus]|uniref:ABC transporter permease n=1 Tax=Lederbergia TaxID=2804231 RepID=UPI001DE335D0|nr:ABC transporter permease [Lederbergia ruris]MBP1916427.1 peptide/nickel transport system permease protein [Lederbergia galactosidilytica]